MGARVAGAAPTWLRALLAVAVVVGGLGGLLCLPASGDLRSLVAHAQRGDVRVLQLDEAGLDDGTHTGLDDDTGTHLLWLDRRGLRHDVLLPQEQDGTRSVDAVATVLAESPPGQRPRVEQPGTLARERAAGLGTAALALLVLSLVFGPQPRRATKWAWFWLLVALPLGAGAGLLLAREAPWSRATTREREPVDRFDREPGVRTSGGVALVAAVLVTLLLQVFGYLLVQALPYSGHLEPREHTPVLTPR